jgi:hypothetical protein
MEALPINSLRAPTGMLKQERVFRKDDDREGGEAVSAIEDHWYEVGYKEGKSDADAEISRLRQQLATAIRQRDALKEALEFYKDPYTYSLRQNGPNDPIPDFYSELDFGSRARAALASLDQPADATEGPAHD